MNYDKFFARFYQEHPEMIKETRWKNKLICILENYYKSYFTNNFIETLHRLPVDFETLRREDQQYRSEHSCVLEVKRDTLFYKEKEKEPVVDFQERLREVRAAVGV